MTRSAPRSEVKIDFDTLESQTVAMRERDSMQQIRLPIDAMEAHLASTLDA